MRETMSAVTDVSDRVAILSVRKYEFLVLPTKGLAMKEAATTRRRRTVMYFCFYPPTTKAYSWLEYVRKRMKEAELAIWYRVTRKTPLERIEDRNIRIDMCRLRPKWHDKHGETGMIEATAEWVELEPKIPIDQLEEEFHREFERRFWGE